MSHPNKKQFEGVIGYVDVPSDVCLSGSSSHRVILTETAARKALPSIKGMAVNYKENWSGHDYKRKFGVITKAWIERNEIRVKGYIFARDFPEEISKLSSCEEKMGMSFEIINSYVKDTRSEIWVLERVGYFSGAAILYKSLAAYKTTSFRLV